jgi:Smg protein
MAGDPLRERVLAIVSLIAQYVMEDRDFLTEGEIIEELLAEGFAAEEIDAAFSWMESYSMQNLTPRDHSLTSPTNRVFTAEEARSLSAEARGFLVRLRTMGILDDELHEEILDRALQSAEEEVSLKDLKTITALTLFTRANNQWRREVDCIIEDDWASLYH